ncbi:site-specific integrase [Dongia deserti]|uniref:hypothetical protein n=1 Tax=Dongia deserti TaxID=2268030 RepID=UPI0013C41FA6|nr:hypothetical protein [Dongia deserti]
MTSRSSKRIVPVHPALLELGFSDLWHRARRRGQRRIFEDVPVAPTGYYSDTFSKWFARFLKRRSLAEGLCFHSFRHNFRDALRAARVPREIALQLGGWSGPPVDWSEMGRLEKHWEATGDKYGDGYVIDVLMSELRKVGYPGLAIPRAQIDD